MSFLKQHINNRTILNILLISTSIFEKKKIKIKNQSFACCCLIFILLISLTFNNISGTSCLSRSWTDFKNIWLRNDTEQQDGSLHFSVPTAEPEPDRIIRRPSVGVCVFPTWRWEGGGACENESSFLHLVLTPGMKDQEWSSGSKKQLVEEEEV